MPPKNAKTPAKQISKRKSKKSIFRHLPNQDYYEKEIVRLNCRLAQLKIENRENKTKNLELDDKKEEIIVDRSDINQYITRILNVRDVEIMKVLDSIKYLEKTIATEEIQHEKEVADKQAYHVKWFKIFSSDIKILYGSLEMLEKFRKEKAVIMIDYTKLERLLSEQFYRHQREIYETERNIAINTSTLVTEVDTRLKLLATNFEKTSGMRVAAHTQRLIRENIALNSEMDRLLLINKRLQNEFNKCIQTRSEEVNDTNIVEVMNSRIIKSKEAQALVSEELTDVTYNTTVQLTFLRNAENRISLNTEEIKRIIAETKIKREKLKILENHNRKVLDNVNQLMEQENNFSIENLKLLNYFEEIKKLISHFNDFSSTKPEEIHQFCKSLSKHLV